MLCIWWLHALACTPGGGLESSSVFAAAAASSEAEVPLIRCRFARAAGSELELARLATLPPSLGFAAGSSAASGAVAAAASALQADASSQPWASQPEAPAAQEVQPLLHHDAAAHDDAALSSAESEDEIGGPDDAASRLAP